jgi:hypothetical protein
LCVLFIFFLIYTRSELGPASMFDPSSCSRLVCGSNQVGSRSVFGPTLDSGSALTFFQLPLEGFISAPGALSARAGSLSCFPFPLPCAGLRLQASPPHFVSCGHGAHRPFFSSHWCLTPGSVQLPPLGFIEARRHDIKDSFYCRVVLVADRSSVFLVLSCQSVPRGTVTRPEPIWSCHPGFLRVTILAVSDCRYL